MKKVFFIVTGLFSLAAFVQPASAQTNFAQKLKHDISSSLAYFSIADRFIKNETVSDSMWQVLFKSSPYNMMIEGRAIDTSELKQVMNKVYTGAITSSDTGQVYSYHQRYRQNMPSLRKYLLEIQSSVFDLPIRQALVPFIKNVQTDQLPSYFHTVYGSEEATGFQGMVINDLYKAWLTDKYAPGLMSAHEGYHAVVSMAFQNAVKKEADLSSAQFGLLSALEIISEEGIADLIDKSQLAGAASPVSKEVQTLLKDDSVLAPIYIKNIDSLLKQGAADTANFLREEMQNGTLYDLLGKNGGHIPGRFMAKAIADAGLLDEFLRLAYDPVRFIKLYQKAAEGSDGALPQFSASSIALLDRVKMQFMNF